MMKNNVFAARLPIAVAALFLFALPCSFGATVAGHVSGQASVNRTGGLSYVLPILVPPGIDGFQPSLAVGYDSSAPNGLLGRGFTLNGVSSIQRCGQTKRVDNDARPVSLSDKDRFCLDGLRLVLDGQTKTYGADGAVYRGEIDNFSRITSYGKLGTGPEKFQVKTKSGATLEYGYTSDSRHLLAKPNADGTAPESPLAWSLNKATDAVGNVIEYAYAVNIADGSQYLSQVSYNRKTAQGLARAAVKFSYLPDSMPSQKFIGGGLVSRNKLLTAVNVYAVDGQAGETEQWVRTYRFSYSYGDLKGDRAENSVAMLDTIELCGRGGDCLPPIKFNWASALQLGGGFLGSKRIFTDNKFARSNSLSSDVSNPRRFVDLNRDGILDLVGFLDDGVYVGLSAPEKVAEYPASPKLAIADFGPNHSGWEEYDQLDYSPRHLVDMNKDGYADIVGFSYEKGLYLSFWNRFEEKFDGKMKIANGEDFSNTGWGIGACRYDEAFPRFLVDMNKDGYPDVLGVDEQGTRLSYWNGIVLADSVIVADDLNKNHAEDTDCSGQLGGPIFVLDMNSDGFPDLLQVSINGVLLRTWNPQSGKFDPKRSVLTEFKGGNHNYSSSFAGGPYDVNGDGQVDLVKFAKDGIRVALWTGTGFNASTIWTTEFKTDGGSLNRSPLRLADVNGDGFPDLVAFSGSGVKVALNNGSSKFLQSRIWTEEFSTGETDDSTGNKWEYDLKTPRHLVDLDGDGQIDILGFGSKSVQWASQKTAPDVRLIGVTDSLGAETKIEYTVLQGYSGFYDDDSPACQWPCIDGHGPHYAVSRIVRDTGTGSTRETRHRYEGRKYDFYDGPLGFARMYERDGLTGIERLTTYHQTMPLLGAVQSEETYMTTLARDDVVSGCLSFETLCYRDFVVSKGQSLSSRSLAYRIDSLGAAGESPVSYQRKFIAPSTTTANSWELDGTVLPKTVTVDAYDEPKQWGNLTSRTVTTSKAGETGSFVTTTTEEYYPADEVNWKLGRVSKRTVTASRPKATVVTETPTEMALTPDKAGPKPLPPGVLSAILGLLLDDE